MESRSILIVHPYDKTTIFLSRIKSHLKNNFSKDVHVFNIYPNYDSHQKCTEVIASQPSDSLIIFLGHGHSEHLYGSKGKFHGQIGYIEEDLILEYPDYYYCNDCFIHEDNVSIMSNKKVFCLACNSNDAISDMAIANDVKVFLGFGSIPTSEIELSEYKNFSEKDLYSIKRILIKIKSELVYIIKRSLFHAIINNYTFNNLLSLMSFIFNQRISSILMDERLYKEKYLIIEHLYRIQKNIIIKGDGDLKLLN